MSSVVEEFLRALSNTAQAEPAYQCSVRHQQPPHRRGDLQGPRPGAGPGGADHRRRCAQHQGDPVSFDPQYEYRTGIGTDIHRLVEERELKLGGVQIPFNERAAGPQRRRRRIARGDRCAAGRIGHGRHRDVFSRTATRNWKDADSRELLLTITQYLADQRWEVVNLDVIIHAEQPRLEPYKMQIKRCIASILGIDFAQCQCQGQDQRRARRDRRGAGDRGDGDRAAATTTQTHAIRK